MICIKKLDIKSVILLIVFISISNNCLSQSKLKNHSSIKGELVIDSVWAPIIYLSHIPTFKDMFKVSNNMIISRTNIDSSGFFRFYSNDLLRKDNLYRLHISKKDAPAASLIIGGKEENHIFFIANSNSNIFITNKKGISLFDNYRINGSKSNEDFFKVVKIIDSIDDLDSKSSNMKREFIEKSFYEQLRLIADTSSHQLVSLYAINNSKFEATFLDEKKFYNTYLDKWKNENSPYLREFRAKFPEKKENNFIITFFIIGFIFFILGYLVHYYFKQKHKSQLLLLSAQERKIFNLIQAGKSNKEISEAFNIEVNTVKSHVSNIYSKLGIKSRKEAMNFI